MLNIKRVSSYSAISYELTYQSEGIDRGVQGNLNTNDKKAEYTQEILFGTCSTTDTFNIKHCVFDKNVENGTLTLKIQKDDKLYRMLTTWHFQKPDVALGVISSADSHFRYKVSSATDSAKNTVVPQDLVVVGFSIVNDLTGVPKLPDAKQVLGKVYAFNVPSTRSFPSGEVTIELAENPPTQAKIARFDPDKSEWQMLETKITGSTLKSTASGTGIFAVLTPTQQAK